MVPLYESTGHFEVVEPELAQNTANERRYYACDIDRFLAAPADYAFEEAQRDRVADPLAPQPTEA